MRPAEGPPLHYMLDGTEPVPTFDVVFWRHWYAAADRSVDGTEVGPIIVSTVFLGVDQAGGKGAAPILFETAVFGAGDNNLVRTCATWQEAVALHNEGVALAKGLVEQANASMSAAGIRLP